MPIALSIVEGCAQPPHRNWSNGVTDWWSDGFKTDTLKFEYSQYPLFSRASLLDLFEQPAKVLFRNRLGGPEEIAERIKAKG
jgi:hypothetical protein